MDRTIDSSPYRDSYSDGKRIKQEIAPLKKDGYKFPRMINIPSFENSLQIDSTHDNPWVKGFIPKCLKERRKLSKIENGQKHRLSIMPDTYVPTRIGLWDRYKLKSHPSLFIRGSEDRVEEMGRRLYRLWLYKRPFFDRLIGLDVEIELEVVREAGLTQVVVHKKGNPEFDDSFLPLEWCSAENYKKVIAILNAIEEGRGYIQIERGHPHRDAILQHLFKLSARPSGRKLLIELGRKVNNFILISYKKSKNSFSFNSDSAAYSTIYFDDDDNLRLITINKYTHKFEGMDPNSAIRLGHELVHALHKYGNPEPDKEHRIIADAIFDPATATFYSTLYPCRNNYAYYTNPEEQDTILGDEIDPDLSENALRYVSCQPLRWTHFAYDSKLESSTALCNLLFMEQFPSDHLHIAIMKKAHDTYDPIIQSMGLDAVRESLQRADIFFARLDSGQQKELKLVRLKYLVMLTKQISKNP